MLMLLDFFSFFYCKFVGKNVAVTWIRWDGSSDGHVTCYKSRFLTAQNEAFQKMFCSFQMSNVQDHVIVLVDS